MPPLSIPLHHSEPGDPALFESMFEWMSHQIDAMVGLGPAAIALLLGMVILAIPVGIGIAYWATRARQSRGGA